MNIYAQDMMKAEFKLGANALLMTWNKIRKEAQETPLGVHVLGSLQFSHRAGEEKVKEETNRRHTTLSHQLFPIKGWRDSLPFKIETQVANKPSMWQNGLDSTLYT